VDVIGQLHGPAVLSEGSEPDRRIGGSHSWSGCGVEQ